MTTRFHPSPNGYSIAYEQSAGEGVGVVFIHGFRSDKNGSKAIALEEFCKSHKIPFTRFDCFAHGETKGDFLEFTIGHALADTLEILDHVATGPQILIGSSMGGWVMLCAALERKTQVNGLIGVAAAPDFTETFPAKMTPEERRQMEEDGVIWRMSEYWGREVPTTRHLFEEAKAHLLMDHPIPFDGPVHLLQGQRDEDVAWPLALEIAAKLTSPTVNVSFIKDGDHRLSRPEDMRLLFAALVGMRENLS
ncbi:MAG: alpha/beta hydrolase [Rickettsiales bacterium]|jgi:pimeloyl-ACP methyl ester carboxylesterase|nr:alpha/beta hydrolase [Rickettsiales bacterium]